MDSRSKEGAAARFVVDGGSPITLAEFVAANADDPDACVWARGAKPGDFYPGVVTCECVGVAS